MKKLTALLLSCMLITSAFASCGSEGGTNDSDSKAATSDTAETTDEMTTEEDTTEEPTEEEPKNSTSLKDKASRQMAATEKTTKEKTTKEKATEPPAAEDSEFIGKWELVRIDKDGTSYTEDNAGVSLRGAIHIEIDEDGTGECYDMTTKDTLSFDWQEKSSTKLYIVDEEGDDDTLVIKGGYLVVDDGSDLVMYFEKVNKYTDYPEDGGSSSSSEVKFIGKWELTGLQSDGTVYDSSDDPTIQGAFAIEIKEDGTGTIYDFTEDETEEYEFTWKLEGSKLLMSDETSDSYFGVIKDGKLVIADAEDDDDFAMIFGKVSHFSEYQGGW